MEEIERMWAAYEKYKETAEQHEFPFLLGMDLMLVPAYKDLKDHYTEEHAEIFKRCLRKLFDKLGIKQSENL